MLKTWRQTSISKQRAERTRHPGHMTTHRAVLPISPLNRVRYFSLLPSFPVLLPFPPRYSCRHSPSSLKIDSCPYDRYPHLEARTSLSVSLLLRLIGCSRTRLRTVCLHTSKTTSDSDEKAWRLVRRCTSGPSYTNIPVSQAHTSTPPKRVSQTLRGHDL